MHLAKTTRMPRRFGVAAVVFVFALIAAGCSGESPGQAATAVSEPAQSQDGTATTESLVLPTADGGQIDWNSLQGQDVMLWFWAPW